MLQAKAFFNINNVCVIKFINSGGRVLEFELESFSCAQFRKDFSHFPQVHACVFSCSPVKITLVWSHFFIFIKDPFALSVCVRCGSSVAVSEMSLQVSL